MTDKIQTILSQEEEALNTAKARAIAAHANEPTPATQKSLAAADKALADFARRKAEALDETVPTVKAAHTWILERYDARLKYSTFALHAQKGYHLIGDPTKTLYRIPHQRGRYLPGDLDLYCRNRGYLPRNGAAPAGVGPAPDDNRELLEARERINLATARIQEAKAGEIEGRLIRRAEVEARNAQAAAFLKNDLSNYGPYLCDRFVAAVSDYLKGSGIDLDSVNLTSVIPDLLTDYDTRLDQWLDRYVAAVEVA